MRAMCRGKCERWKNLVNFIHDLPKYVIANQCIICNKWYPKNYSIVFCPCCRLKLRYKKQQYDRRKKHTKTQKEIVRILEMHVAVGWKPINVSVYEDLQQYMIYEKELKEKGK